MDASTYFIGNRLWWSVSLFAAPVAGAITGQLIVAFLVGALLLLPSFVLFDTGRGWWSDEVRRLPQDPARTRVETRILTLWSGLALVAGLAIAIARPWG
jgi:hypothetical protein